MARTYRMMTLLAAVAFGCAGQAPPAKSPEPVGRDLQSLVVLPAESDARQAADSSPAAPTTRPALPPGHPPLPDAAAAPTAAQPRQELPPGHPPVPGRDSPLPEGHPPIAPKASAPAPAANAADNHAHGEPIVGTVTIRPVQSTPGGPAIEPGTAIVVELHDHGKISAKVEGKLTEDGTLQVADVPMGPHLAVVARMVHGGVSYEGRSPDFDGQTRDVEIRIPVYEATERRPDWTIAMRHMVVQPAHGKLHVMEVLVVENPADHAWTGELRPDGKRSAFALPLPAGAADLALGEGFDDCCSLVENGMVVETRPLAPGSKRYRVSYTLPIESGAATLATALPAPVRAMMIMLPDMGLKIDADGIGAAEAINMGSRRSMLLKGQDLPAGRQVKLTISDIPASAMTHDPQPAAAAGAAVDPAKIGRAIGGIGALIVLVLGASFVLLKPRARKSA